jgi:5-methylthioadenosine/S-adenosylhomocysteine deaminase
VSADFVRDGTQLAIAEMLRAGITCFADLYLFPEEAARVAAAARMRAVIGLPVSEQANAWADGLTEHLARAERLWDAYRSDPWVSLYFAAEATAASDTTLTRLRRVVDELDARVMLPLQTSADYGSPRRLALDIQDSARQGASRPLTRLQQLGLLRPGFTAIHPDVGDEADLATIAETAIAVVACPQSSRRLEGEDCPIAQLTTRGVAVALGTDNPASVGALDVLAEARAGALLARGHLSAPALLRMATLGGATALGLGGLIGSIEPGKAADLVCFDLSALACQPPGQPAEALVFAATRAQASDVWTGGRAAVSDYRLLALDEEQARALSRQWAGRIGLEQAA